MLPRMVGMLPEEFKALRMKVGRQWDLAVLMGVTTMTVKRKENGQSKITEDEAEKLRELVAGHVTEFEGPMLVRKADTEPSVRSGDVLVDNVMHWYVEPGYVMCV